MSELSKHSIVHSSRRIDQGSTATDSSALQLTCLHLPREECLRTRSLLEEAVVIGKDMTSNLSNGGTGDIAARCLRSIAFIPTAIQDRLGLSSHARDSFVPESRRIPIASSLRP